MLRSLGHVTVRSTDFDRTEAFYCGLLGLQPGPRPQLAVPGRWYYLGDAAVLHVLPCRAEGAQGAGGAIDHYALTAGDLAGFEARLAAAAQPYVRQRLGHTDVWQVFLTDPDGARVELCFSGPDGPAGGPRPDAPLEPRLEPPSAPT